ncbi:MAG: hypothetical protein R2704_00410 [Microthrixaceae bacterium]
MSTTAGSPDPPATAQVDWSVRTRLADALSPIAARLGDVSTGRVDVDVFGLADHRRCPGFQSEPFAWTARFARRSLGLAALAELPYVEYRGDRALDRAEATQQGRSLGDWLDELPPGGYRAVRAEAATWLAAAVGAIGLGQLLTLTWESPPGRFDWKAPGTPLVVSARLEGATADHRRATDLGLIRLVDGAFGAADERRGAGWLAALHATRFGVQPTRVIVLDLRQGRRRTHRVSPDLLEGGIEAITSAAAAAVERALNEPAEGALTPGRHCAYCARRPICPRAQPEPTD